ncbi:MAG: Xre family transcriptional regulator [Bacillota bacterium]|jgi:transcriptional regulator with XRE-family HTH domain|nr:Xre family transcriptional regulator [Bacillota bacterium]
MDLNERLRYLRIKNNLTAKEFSKLFDISESSVSLYENGKRTPSLSLIIEFADFFKVSTDYILGKTNIPTQYNTKDTQFDFAKQLQTIINIFDEKDIILFNGDMMNEQFKNVFKKTLVNISDTMNLLSDDYKIM